MSCLPTLHVNFRGSLLLDVRRMLPPERSPCKMLRLCKYARALAISFAVSLHTMHHDCRHRSPTFRRPLHTFCLRSYVLSYRSLYGLLLSGAVTWDEKHQRQCTDSLGDPRSTRNVGLMISHPTKTDVGPPRHDVSPPRHDTGLPHLTDLTLHTCSGAAPLAAAWEPRCTTNTPLSTASCRLPLSQYSRTSHVSVNCFPPLSWSGGLMADLPSCPLCSAGAAFGVEPSRVGLLAGVHMEDLWLLGSTGCRTQERPL